MSKWTMGAMASKKASAVSSVRVRMAAASAGEVRGPVATMTLDQSGGGRPATSARSMVTRGWASRRAVISAEKGTRSMASALPAGTAWRSAVAMTRPEAARISQWRRPTAFCSWSSERKELEQTSSARAAVWWAGVPVAGRISCRTTGTPISAACQAASEPARPPPMTWIGSIMAADLGQGRGNGKGRYPIHLDFRYIVNIDVPA